jgi:hypothetical protein
VLFTHNDRGLRDSPAPGEDTDSATVWAIRPDGTLLARIRLTNNGVPIPYSDTEAISTDRSHRTVNGVQRPEQIVLADTGNNVDPRDTVALYRFTPPFIDATVTPAVVPTIDIPAEIIPFQYFTKATGGTLLTLNVEAFMVDRAGNGWFIPRSATLPYSYKVTANALDAAANTSTPARAVRSTRLQVNGPMTDASIPPTGPMMFVKTMTNTYAYALGSDVGAALGTMPCLVAVATTNKSAGYGEALTARDDGGFYTLAEGAKTARGTAVSPIWSFS